MATYDHVFREQFGEGAQASDRARFEYRDRCREGWWLLRSTADVLLESTPAGLNVDSLTTLMAGVDGVESVHDLHVWTLSSDVRAMSAHVVLDGHPSLEEAQVVGARVKSAIAGPFRISHATLELECEACGVPDNFCSIDTP